jgi:hypothetical protein
LTSAPSVSAMPGQQRKKQGKLIKCGLDIWKAEENEQN